MCVSGLKWLKHKHDALPAGRGKTDGRSEGNTPAPSLTRQVLVSTGLVPLAAHLHQFVAQGVLVLLGLVGVELPVGLGVRLGVRVGRVGDEGVGRVDRRLGSAVQWGHHGAAPVAVDAEAALARHLDQLRSRAGGRRQGHVAGAEGHAAHRPVDAGALVLAAGAEILAVLINPPVVFARPALGLG